MSKRILIATAATTVACVLLHLYLLDGLGGSLAALAFGDDTAFSNGYTSSSFRRVSVGDTAPDVRKRLGNPWRDIWIYDAGSSIASVYFADGRVVHIQTSGDQNPARLRPGMTFSEVLAAVGPPPEKSYVYSHSPHNKSYRVRSIVLRRDRVAKKNAYFYVD